MRFIRQPGLSLFLTLLVLCLNKSAPNSSIMPEYCNVTSLFFRFQQNWITILHLGSQYVVSLKQFQLASDSSSYFYFAFCGQLPKHKAATLYTKHLRRDVFTALSFITDYALIFTTPLKLSCQWHGDCHLLNSVTDNQASSCSSCPQRLSQLTLKPFFPLTCAMPQSAGVPPALLPVCFQSGQLSLGLFLQLSSLFSPSSLPR